MKAYAFDCQTLRIAFAPGDIPSATMIGDVLTETHRTTLLGLHRRKHGKPPAEKSNKGDPEFSERKWKHYEPTNWKYDGTA